jgi:hypothetical protein
MFLARMTQSPSGVPLAVNRGRTAQRQDERQTRSASAGSTRAAISRIGLVACLQGILLVAGLVLFPQTARSVSLAWDADPQPDIAGYKLYYGSATGSYTNDIDVGNVTTTTLSGLVNGVTYYFAATAYDTLGLESGYSGEVNYTVPSTNAPPAILLTSPSNGASYAAPATINLAATVTASGHNITQVQFYNGASLLGAVATTPYNFAWTNVTTGTFSLSAQIIYDAGSTLVSNPANVIVTNPPPLVALSSPLNSASFAAPATINLVATVTPNGHNITRVQFYNGASLLGPVVTPPYTFAWHNIAAGTLSLSAQVIYDAGSTLASAPVSVTVTNPPPLVVLSSPLNGASYAAPATINLAATVTANGHNVTLVQFYNGTNLLGQSASAPYNLGWNNVNAGNFTLTARVLFDSGSSITSSPANVVVNGLPLPWQTADIGLVGLVGSAGYDSTTGTFTVTGSGAGIGNTSDQFRFLWQTASGDGEIRARVTAVQNTDGNAKAGVMIRETLNANSRFVALVMTPTNGAGFQYRDKTGGRYGGVQSAGTTTPYWVRVVRTGNTFTGYISNDGLTWSQVGNPRSITMASNVYIGMCVTSRNNTELNTSTFNNVTAVP